MITEQTKFELIHSSINFLKTVTRAYGNEKGMQLWETIADTVDPSLKGDVFTAMLMGNYRGIIFVHSCQDSSNRVGMVKAIRSVDGSGLKEAKDLMEKLVDGQSIEIKCDPMKYHEGIAILRMAGMNV